ncbi:immunoglobulin-like domain-containing protein, partial [Litoribaculum gwangyangense]|uniref:immunoglobulin-like domain-containing protein n=1 Tax=Litoribaculum gwangyangense TaxID=1130722 RepID=UPI0031F17BEB
GATASDNKDGDITANIVIGGDIVNTNIPGSYIITYNVSDAAGNAATQVTRTVNVTSLPTDIVIHEGYFETGLDGWTEGGNDCSRISSSNSYEGSFSMRLRDGNGISSSMTSSTFNLSSYSQVKFSFYFYASTLNNGDSFSLLYNDGTGFSIVDTWLTGVDFQSDTFNNFLVTIDTSSYNLSTNGRFRIQSNTSKKNEQIYIDQIIITGISNSSGSSAKSNPTSESGKVLDTVDNTIYKNELTLYPNPVRGDILNIKLSKGLQIVSYKIINTLGQIVNQGKTNKEVIVNNLEAGVYFIEVNDNTQIITKRFIRSK